VHREYYINDAGRQMDILATSVCCATWSWPARSSRFLECYKGDYVYDIGATLHRENADQYRHPAATVFAGVPADEPAGGDKEKHIDGLIERAKQLLGPADLPQGVRPRPQCDPRRHPPGPREFGVKYDEWYSERALVERGAADTAIARLKKSGHAYEKDGALWFRSTDYGDEKDRVLVRDNGQKTYFAHDIAYHMDKLERGFERVIDIWGADHHGYVPRVKAALAALGDDPSKLDVLLFSSRSCTARRKGADVDPLRRVS